MLKFIDHLKLIFADETSEVARIEGRQGLFDTGG